MMRIDQRGLLIVAAALSLACSWAKAAEFTVEKKDDRVVVNLDGKLFTEYLIESGKKPILWPIIGPTGKAMTRPYPMDPSQADPKDKTQVDHPWHRSMWLNHAKVNGQDVWTDRPGTGSIKHREFLDVSGGKEVIIATTNDWLDKNGKKLCEDRRTITCSVDGDNRIIDFDCTITATDGDVTFGDDKDGLFGVRVPDSMRVDAKLGGTFINSNGLIDEAGAWGKAADWIDYHGPVEGETLGIAILNHPNSYGYPTHWHTRNYGLFAANPFGLHNFDPDSGVHGDYTLKQGDTLTVRYRVIFHKGDEKEGRIAEAFSKYSQQP